MTKPFSLKWHLQGLLCAVAGLGAVALIVWMFKPAGGWSTLPLGALFP